MNIPRNSIPVISDDIGTADYDEEELFRELADIVKGLPKDAQDIFIETVSADETLTEYYKTNIEPLSGVMILVCGSWKDRPIGSDPIGYCEFPDPGTGAGFTSVQAKNISDKDFSTLTPQAFGASGAASVNSVTVSSILLPLALPISTALLIVVIALLAVILCYIAIAKLNHTSFFMTGSQIRSYIPVSLYGEFLMEYSYIRAYICEECGEFEDEVGDVLDDAHDEMVEIVAATTAAATGGYAISLDGQTICLGNEKYDCKEKAETMPAPEFEYMPACLVKIDGKYVLFVAPVSISKEVAKAILLLNQSQIGVFAISERAAKKISGSDSIYHIPHGEEGWFPHYHMIINGEKAYSHCWFWP